MSKTCLYARECITAFKQPQTHECSLVENAGLPEGQKGRGILPEPGGTYAVLQVIYQKTL